MSKSSNLNAIETAEFAELLDLAYYDFDDPKRFGKLREVADYFRNREGKRETILRIIQKSPIKDPLDAVWNWVQLANERTEKINSLPKEMFEENVVEEINKEYIKKDTISRVKDQIDKKIVEFEKQKRLKEQQQAAELETSKLEKKSVKEAVETSQLLEVKKTLEEVESINNILNEI